ncbi:hypothetical protein K4H02_24775, partial [Mycobacterium tuberculosis]|nr:hypothetical protein [Mycobacterium tuberculosis]
MTAETLHPLPPDIKQPEAQLDELTQQLSATMRQFEHPFSEAQSALDQADARSSELHQQLGTEFE